MQKFESWNAREQRRLFFVVAFALALVAAFVLIAYLFRGLAFAVRATSYCEASECLRHVELLTHGLNRSIDPCQDFQAYVCSTWNPDSRFPEVSATALDDLAISWLDDLPNMLEESAKDWPVARKPLAMFQSCVRRGNVSSDFNRREFLDFLKALRLSWPEKPANGHEVKHILIDLIIRWELTLWLRVRLIKHPLVPDAWRLLVTHAWASSIRLFTENHKRVMARDSGYSRYWKLLYSFVKGVAPGPEVDDIIRTSARLQSNAVALLLEIEAWKDHLEPVILPLTDAPKLTLGSMFEGTLEQFKGGFNIVDIVVLYPKISPALTIFLAEVGETDILWHLSWEFVQMYAPMVDRGLLEEIVDDAQHATFYLRLLCAREVDTIYSPLLAALYSRVRLTDVGRSRTSFLFQSLVKTSVQRLKEVTWLEDDTKQFLSSKLEAVDVRLWPSSLFDDPRQVDEVYSSCPDNESAFTRLWVKARRCLSTLLVGPHRYDSTTLLPNVPSPLVTYDNVVNTIDVAVSALASPVYSERGTAGMTFGGLGFLFLSALMRVLDKEAQYSHTNGSTASGGSWISPRSLIALEERERCACFGNNRRTPGGTAIAAVEIAYSLFLERSRNTFQLNLTHELTDEKVFFMTLCRMTCAKKDAPWALVSCQQLVNHFPEFSAAFSCGSEWTQNKGACRYF
ncbi:hypothetical protein HPB48_018587 [Haemaphysalis longicornis]|uniref:Peptidase M13 N-terminal domain-containing protein n=1 Tax=Haemaphysalis longicornis TaxID=44386 RepID=A0A9J6G795_HAELO|nr:hypothetical protein HPB48_018587 [Haemaphysalis longicornis]